MLKIFIVISGYAINGFSSYLSFKVNKIIKKDDTSCLIVKRLRNSQQKNKKAMVQIEGCRGRSVFILQSVDSFSGLRLLENRREITASILPNYTPITSKNYGRHERSPKKQVVLKEKLWVLGLKLSSLLCVRAFILLYFHLHNTFSTNFYNCSKSLVLALYL